MLGFSRSRQTGPVLPGKRVVLRMPRASDHDAWTALRKESRDFLVPWEPSWSADEFDRSVWRQRLRRYDEDYRCGHSTAFLIFDMEQRLLGGITLGGIRHGVSQSAHIGYWMGERHAGQGYMHEAIKLVTGHAFGRLGLHRIEAACIPDNERSIRVLEKAGFSREGLLRSYLRINGAWRDHLLYALLSTDGKAPRKADS